MAIPRLVEGNAALRAFTVATKTPWSLSFERKTGDFDHILPLSVVER